MTDSVRLFNWNGGASLSSPPGFATSAAVATSIEFIPGHYLSALSVTNLTSTTMFIHLYDGTSTPAAGTVPLRSYPIASAGAVASTGLGGGQIDIGIDRFFQTGIVVALSSTQGSLSLASVGTMLLDAQYK